MMDLFGFNNQSSFSPADIATVLGVSEETIKRLCRSAELRAVKVSESWRVPRKALEDYLTQHSNSVED